MNKTAERQEQLVVVGFVILGAVNMLLHPRKTYRLLVHKVGWYD